MRWLISLSSLDTHVLRVVGSSDSKAAMLCSVDTHTHTHTHTHAHTCQQKDTSILGSSCGLRLLYSQAREGHILMCVFLCVSVCVLCAHQLESDAVELG